MEFLCPIVRFSGCEGDGKGQVPTKRKKSGSDQKKKRAEIDLINSEERLIDNLFPSGVVEDFVTTHFRRHPFVARGSNECLVTLKKLLYEFNVAELLENSASERIHVWLSHKGSESSLNSQSLDSISVDDHTQAMKLYVAGHSIYCRAPLELEKAVVPRLLNDLGLGVTGSGTDKYRRGEIELFLSRKGHATDFHTDFQENFTIQISGKKKWTFRESTATSPLRACTPHFKAPQDNDQKKNILGLKQQETDLYEQQLKVLRMGDPNFTANQFLGRKDVHSNQRDEEVDLGPGDVMYHPAGIWHRVECEEDSISINISLITSSYAEIFCSGLQQILCENLAYRGSVLSGNPQNAKESSRIMEDIIAAVPRLLERMRNSDFLPVPCLNVTAPVDEKKETSNSSAGYMVSRQSIEKTHEEETSFDESDEDEEDEDNDDDTNSNTPNPIYAENVPKVVVHDKNLNQRYRINPLVKIITSTDIKQFQGGSSSSNKNDKDSDSDAQAYIVHAGYGNETFESVLRQVIIVPKAMELSAVLLVGAITLHQNARQRTYEFDSQRNTKKRGRDHEVSESEWHSTSCVTVKSIACITKKSKGLVSTADPLQLTRQLLDAFVLAGALTLED